MPRRGDPERIYQAQRAGVFMRLMAAERLDAFDAEHWISRWEREAEANGPAVGSQGYWDAAWRWIAENVGSIEEPAPYTPTALGRRIKTRVWVPPVRLRRTLGRVARPTEHGAVGDVEGRATGCERHDVIDRQVTGRMGGTLVCRAPVAVLTAPGPQYSRTQALPRPCAVQRVVTTAVRLPSVGGAATTRPAGQNAASRAELHGPHRPCAVSDMTLVTLECTPVDIAMSVIGEGGGVYSARVLRLGSQGHVRVSLPLLGHTS